MNMGCFRSRPEPGNVTEFMEGGGNGSEALVFNAENGKLEVMNKEKARARPGRQVITSMNEPDGGGFFFWQPLPR